MRSEPIVDKETKKQLTTKAGEPLVNNYLEAGDKFIPVFNSVAERKTEGKDKAGKKKVITNYSLKCRVRDKTGIDCTQNGEKEIFVNLTPTQAKRLNKYAKEEGVELNQNLFDAYEYSTADYPDEKFVGVGMAKDRKSPKSFSDFDNNAEEETVK